MARNGWSVRRSSCKSRPKADRRHAECSPTESSFATRIPCDGRRVPLDALIGIAAKTHSEWKAGVVMPQIRACATTSPVTKVMFRLPDSQTTDSRSTPPPPAYLRDRRPERKQVPRLAHSLSDAGCSGGRGQQRRSSNIGRQAPFVRIPTAEYDIELHDRGRRGSVPSLP